MRSLRGRLRSKLKSDRDGVASGESSRLRPKEARVATDKVTDWSLEGDQGRWGWKVNRTRGKEG